MIIEIKNTKKGAWFALENFCYNHLKVLLRYLIVKNGEERIINYQLVSSFLTLILLRLVKHSLPDEVEFRNGSSVNSKINYSLFKVISEVNKKIRKTEISKQGCNKKLRNWKNEKLSYFREIYYSANWNLIDFFWWFSPCIFDPITYTSNISSDNLM